MKTTIITILSIIILISTVSALQIYPGETITFKNEMGITNLVYTFVGNSYNVTPLEVHVNSTNISITFPQDMIPDSFDIIFLEEQTKTVVQTVNVGGGGGGGSSGGSTRTVYEKVYVPEIFETEVIKEVPGEEVIQIETVVEETVVNNVPLWMWILFILGGITIIILIFYNLSG